jgi:hypothetical protein
LACKLRFFALPLLKYHNVFCDAVLENRNFRHKILQLKHCSVFEAAGFFPAHDFVHAAIAREVGKIGFIERPGTQNLQNQQNDIEETGKGGTDERGLLGENQIDVRPVAHGLGGLHGPAVAFGFVFRPDEAQRGKLEAPVLVHVKEIGVMAERRQKRQSHNKHE